MSNSMRRKYLKEGRKRFELYLPKPSFNYLMSIKKKFGLTSTAEAFRWILREYKRMEMENRGKST